MATHAQVRAAILKVAGNPESGAIRDLADAMASAVVAIDAPEVKEYKPVVETRVVKPSEKR
jgi:hypothetical protein